MQPEKGFLSFGGHLEVLRRMLFRILGVASVLSCVIFCFKRETFDLLLAPSDSSFVTYHWIEKIIGYFDSSFAINRFNIELIATDLSSQFVNHLTTSIYLGLLCASPLIVIELFNFISPALLETEKRYSVRITLSIYLLFLIGALMSYFILFPISFRFLATYTVANKVHTMITLDSYISSFVSITLLMGLVFQLPVISFILAKFGFLQSSHMATYRKHALIVLAIIAAIITPPDVMTLILVVIPLYCLYEVSIILLKRME